MQQSGCKERELNDRSPNPAMYPSIPSSGSQANATICICRDGDGAVPCTHHLAISYSPEATQNKSNITSAPDPECTLFALCPEPSLLTESPKLSLEDMAFIAPHQLVTVIQTHFNSSVVPLQPSSYGWLCTGSRSLSPLVSVAIFVLRQPERPGMIAAAGNH